MDVKCERCNTEYEFDDALVSGRGTTVKCTNCGHKFKIRRSDGDFSEDFWHVATGDGRTLVFTSLRELQRAIQGYLVERNDRLSRGALPPKAIGQIPELAPFFEQREAARKGQGSGRAIKTQDGLGPAAPGPPASPHAAQPEDRPRQKTKPEFPAPPASEPHMPSAGKATLIGTGPVSSAEAFPSSRTPESSPNTVRQPDAPAIPSQPPVSAPPPTPLVASAPLPPPRAPSDTLPIHRPTAPPVPPPRSTPRISTALPAASPPPLPAKRVQALPPPAPPASSPRIPEMRAQVASPVPPPRLRSLRAEMEDDDARGPSSVSEEPPRRRRGVGGFIVTTVVVGSLLLLGAMYVQKHPGVLGIALPPPPPVARDPRVAGLLAAGEKALAEGNVDLAKESLDKASALSEKDPHVLLGLARLAAIRADVPWLRSRLLEENATDEIRITRDSLTDLANGARRAADAAVEVAPEDPAAIRAKVDALRISGDREAARALVAKSGTGATPSETAYVLAALDLAEAEPLWSTVIDRLKVAASAETGPGRARAALVFALARSGDGASARAEVDRLSAMPKAHPLLPLLRGFADRTKPLRDAGADAAVAELVFDAGVVKRGRAGGAVPSDGRQLVLQGERARAKGEYDKARTFFGSAIDKNPSDSEALAGLAAISYAQRDLAGARASYKRVLSINPNYMPALVGLADVEWDSGDKATATKMYKDIVDRYPPGSYPGRAQQRSEGG